MLDLKYKFIEATREHDDIHDEEYYEDVDKTSSRSAPQMAKSIRNELDCEYVLDIGCGAGALLYEMEKIGVEGVGLEYSEAALEYCRERNVEVLKFDIESDSDPFPQRKFDVVVSMEVAEHLPSDSGDKLVDLMCRHGPKIVFTAATPGQRGANHVNLQPREYWIRKFESKGFSYCRERTKKISEEWKGEVQPHYWKNLMIFQKDK